MQICIGIINRVKVIVTFLIDIIEWVVKTICEWATTIIHHVTEVCEKVCGWLGFGRFQVGLIWLF